MNNRALEEVEDLIYIKNRLLELCMYSLIRDTKIYNHELDDVRKCKFMAVILTNLNDDTFTLRRKLLKTWEDIKDEDGKIWNIVDTEMEVIGNIYEVE